MVKYYTPQTEKLKNGKTKLSIRYTDPSFIGVRKKSTTISKTSKQALNRAEAEVKRKINQALNEIDITQITMADLISQMKSKLIQQGYAPKTLSVYNSRLNIISNHFKNNIVSNISSTSLNKFIDDLLYKKKLSNVSAHQYHVMLLKIYDYAFDFGYVKNNPAKDIKINFKNDRIKKQQRTENWYLTDKEVKEVFNYCISKNRMDFLLFLKFMYLTGLRVGEAGALRNKDIKQNPETKMWYANITGTLIDKKGVGKFRQDFTKTFSSRRKIVLPDEAVKIYSKLKNDDVPDDYLFHNRYSKGPIAVGAIDRFLNQFVKKKKWSKHITSHIFRHTHVSKLAEQGFSLEMIKDRVGHGDSRITAQIYLHITKKQHLVFDKAMQGFK